MNNHFKNKILVTGLVRFGTSWIGNMLSLSNRTTQIFEPFNKWHPKFYGNLKINYHFAYDIKESHAFVDYIENIEKSKFDFIAEFKQLNSIRSIAKFFIKTLPFSIVAKLSKNLIIKDPYAFPLTELFATEFDYKVVLIMRHPGSFVDSMLRFNGKWDRHDYCNSILNQDKLMEKFNLYEFEKSLKQFAQLEKDREKRGLIKLKNEDLRLKRACLIWRIYAKVFLNLKEKNVPNIIPIYYEEFAVNPVSNFSNLYNKLNLNFSTKVEKLIYNSSNTIKTRTKKVVDTKRNSKALANSWEERLSKDQIKYIMVDCKNELNILYKNL